MSWLRDAFVSDVDCRSDDGSLRVDAKAPTRRGGRGLASARAEAARRGGADLHGNRAGTAVPAGTGRRPRVRCCRRGHSTSKVDQYIVEHRIIGPWLDRMQFFDVFSSFWFTAIYVLLFVSLVGCPHPTDDRTRPEPARHTRARAAQTSQRLFKHANARMSGFAPGNRHRLSPKLKGWRRVTRDNGDTTKSRRKGLPARIRQHRVPLRCSRTCLSLSPPQAVRLRGQRHRHRRRRAWRLLRVARRVRLFRAATASTAPPVPDVPSRQRLPGPLPTQRSGYLVRVEHRLPSRNRPGQWNLGSRTCWR